MAPTRPLKRQKTNDSQSQSTQVPKPEQIPLPPDTPSQQSQTDIPDTGASSRLSWYQSWSRKGTKAAPITQLARESSSSLNDTSTETASILTDHKTPRRPSTRSSSLAMTLGKSGSTRSLPVDAMMSKINATSDNVSPSRKSSVQAQQPGTQDIKDNGRREDALKNTVTEQNPCAKSPTEEQQHSAANLDTRQSGWFGWMARNDASVNTANEPETPPVKKPEAATSQTEATAGQESTPPASAQNTTPQINEAATQTQKRTWLQMLGGDSASKPTTTDTPPSPNPETEAHPRSASQDVPNTQKSTKLTDQSQASSVETSPPPPLPHDGNKSAGWVFWSRERNQRPKTPSKDGEQTHEGEIAISDTPSQSKPKRASISMPEEMRPDPKSLKDKKATKASSVKSTERPQTPDNVKKAEPKVTKKAESKNASAVAIEPDPARPVSPAPSKKAVENLLLPAFHDTLHLHQNPTLLQQLARLLYYTKEPELKHLSLVKDPPRIRNALAIGVHGYFPGPMVRTLLGQPTGTSIKFADMAAKSIRKWTNSRGYDCEVKTAALEGEGKIGERVELLWKLLLNWIDEIRKTDFVMVACHSQGVPVAVMLVAKLIQFGCINAARVGICAMAGVSMGPFAEFKSRWISGSAGELFEFSDSTSKVSSDYYAATETVLKAGVRMTLIGSIDDQLVSLESSIFAPITHPHIYRAVLIDSKIHAPGFLSHLVGFVLKLRNLGVQDHGLIRELSSPLAGSLYTGEGHSRIYEDEVVYDMAILFALETTAQLGVDVTRRNTQASSGNPYILPFAMRGILEEDFVRSELREEANQLLQQFDEWKPTTKALKDVKFRLEGVRSKL